MSLTDSKNLEDSAERLKTNIGFDGLQPFIQHCVEDSQESVVSGLEDTSKPPYMNTAHQCIQDETI